MDRKVTERVYAGGKDNEGVEYRADSAYMEDKRVCAWPRKIQGHPTTQSSTETVGEGSGRNDQEKSRR